MDLHLHISPLRANNIHHTPTYQATYFVLPWRKQKGKIILKRRTKDDIMKWKHV
jgi:hypothetical protein